MKIKKMLLAVLVFLVATPALAAPAPEPLTRRESEIIQLLKACDSTKCMQSVMRMLKTTDAEVFSAIEHNNAIRKHRETQR